MKVQQFLVNNFVVSLFLTVMIGFNGTPMARGQDYQSFKLELAQIKKNTKFRIGPLRIFPAFHLYDLGYDNNVFYMHKDKVPISDFTVTLSPEFNTYAIYRKKIIFSLSIRFD